MYCRYVCALHRNKIFAPPKNNFHPYWSNTVPIENAWYICISGSMYACVCHLTAQKSLGCQIRFYAFTMENVTFRRNEYSCLLSRYQESWSSRRGAKKRNCLKNIESKENKLDSHGEHFIQGIEMPGITTTLTLKPDFSEKIYLAL